MSYSDIRAPVFSERVGQIPLVAELLIACDVAKSIAMSPQSVTALSLPCGTLLRSAVAIGEGHRPAVLVWPTTRIRTTVDGSESIALASPPRVVPADFLIRPSLSNSLHATLPTWARCYGGASSSVGAVMWNVLHLPVAGGCAVSVSLRGDSITNLTIGQFSVDGRAPESFTDEALTRREFDVSSRDRLVAIRGKAGDNVLQIQFFTRRASPTSDPDLVASPVWGGRDGPRFAIEAPQALHCRVSHDRG